MFTRKMKLWLQETTLKLQGCLDCTVWEDFIETSRDINELTDEVSSWVSYCEDIVIPEKVVKIYANSEPWVSKHLTVLLNKKISAFKQGNFSELNVLQKEIKKL